MFFDEVRIHVEAGAGGSGVVSFRREAHVPLGGPNGGKGGKGGDVYLEVNPHLNTLIEFKEHVHWRAPRGAPGQGSDKTGAGGDDMVIAVPPGTVVYDEASGEVLADLTASGQRALVAAGGRGGRGNASFASATNHAPRIAEKGEPGQARWLRLELKLIADVGIVGAPNAGKSTLLSVISAARPKIADYPFTTLQPNLGVVVVGNRSFVAADIPGLIEGAHEGVGLGHQFLRHIERTRLLIHLVDGLSADPLADYHSINTELAFFSERLAREPQIVVLNKMDVTEVRERWPELCAAWRKDGVEALAISAATGEGVPELLRLTLRRLDELPIEAPVEATEATFRLEANERAFTIEREGEAWRVRGVAIERAAVMTRWDLDEATTRFQRILNALGITAALQVAGIQYGDMVHIGKVELEWQW